jgi:hypothetical protein
MPTAMQTFWPERPETGYEIENGGEMVRVSEWKRGRGRWKGDRDSFFVFSEL